MQRIFMGVVIFIIILFIVYQFIYPPYRACKYVHPPEFEESQKIWPEKNNIIMPQITDVSYKLPAIFPLTLLFMLFTPGDTVKAQPEVQFEHVQWINDSIVKMQPSKLYYATPVKRFFFGDHYRDVWHAPVRFKVFDIEERGLHPEKVGGGNQTTSLRLEDDQGREYNLRSIDKDPSTILPFFLKNTFIEHILQDQISSEHPFGALSAASLAEAAGVYHANPEIVYVPLDSAFGKYMYVLGGQLALFEEHADEEHQIESFGYSEYIEDSDDMLQLIREKPHVRVNEKAYLRARLLDMLIGDWDRHEGQFRWAAFFENGDTVFYPIPEDRDQVFSKFDGIVPWFFSKRWLIRKFEHFGYGYKDIEGLNFNSGCLDRLLLTELEKEDWLAIADTLQRRISDKKIIKAIKLWPDTVFALTGKEVISKLKNRRNDLDEAAEAYYYLLSKGVNVSGSYQDDHFEVTGNEQGSVNVKIYGMINEKKSGEPYYERTFHPDETKRINLYGLDGDDIFNLNNCNKIKIQIRVYDNDEDKILQECL